MSARGAPSAATRILHVQDRLPPWAAPVVVAGLALLACLALAVIDPATRARYSPGCAFRAVTGLDCPACGATRAVHALVQGEPWTAMDHHVLLVLALPAVLLGWVTWLRAGLGRRPPPAASRGLGLGIASVLALFWLVRNLPWAPLTWLGSGAA